MEDNNNLREKGWYWVKYNNGEPQIAFWKGDRFKFKDGGTSDNEKIIQVVSKKIEFRESQQSESKWINVEERMPEKNGTYLCFLKNDNPKLDNRIEPILRTTHWHNKNIYGENWIKNYKITDWMPLPENPKQ